MDAPIGRNAVEGQHAVQVSGVSKVFNRGSTNQVDALVDIDLNVRKGEFVSLIGPSGCGKSTLLRLIADLIEPTSGDVVVNGKPLGDGGYVSLTGGRQVLAAWETPQGARIERLP